MPIRSLNPATLRLNATYASWGEEELEAALVAAERATAQWRRLPIERRQEALARLATVLRSQIARHAELIVREMGKPIREAEAEVEKCAVLCDYYAERAESMLRDEAIASDASRSFIAYEPLGTLLGVMPWNFPYWQVYRFAVPALMAGNTALLKHASNVPGCALAIESTFRDAGFPDDVFRTLMIDADRVASIIGDPRVHAVTLTGSEAAGRRVAAEAGACMKKSLLELGGSDPFVVLDDADLDRAAKIGVRSRFLNGGQSCIAAKRFIVVDSIADAFVHRFEQRTRELVVGDPLDRQTDIGPMAREDLRDELDEQVQKSIAAGARPLLGAHPLPGPGSYYAPTILDHGQRGMPAYDEELFGPVALIVRAHDEEQALALANDTRFGLGASVWTSDVARGERFARSLQAGLGFVNGLVKSDPRLPFGGVKASGYGRELSMLGIREFTNAKTIWIA